MDRDDCLDRYLSRACDLGAVDARQVAPSSVVTGAWVRMKCQYGCGGYGSSLCCPPHTPAPEQTRQVLDEYTKAVLVRCRTGDEAHRVISVLEREVFLDGFYKAFGLGSGPCRLCADCGRERCAHPAEARPSMEACGVDVFATARNAGFPIRVLTSHDCEQDCYGLVLVE
ncbi:MAG: DUF2284 domain-containing protein [Armatimonadetes bacterium]|nr:DUF2284 domain-containing protein [Armatimonadota bacterium]